MGFGVALFKAIFRRTPLDLSKNAAPKNPIGKNMLENSFPNITILVLWYIRLFWTNAGHVGCIKKMPNEPNGICPASCSTH